MSRYERLLRQLWELHDNLEGNAKQARVDGNAPVENAYNMTIFRVRQILAYPGDSRVNPLPPRTWGEVLESRLH